MLEPVCDQRLGQMTQGMVLCRLLGKDFLSEDAWSRICRHATKSPLPKETTDLETWHKYHVKKGCAFPLLQARSLDASIAQFFSVARLRRPRDDDQRANDR